jgi:hypothetical protein
MLAPTYIAALPNHDKMAAKLKRLFPPKWLHRLIRREGIFCTPSFLHLASTFQKK